MITIPVLVNVLICGDVVSPERSEVSNGSRKLNPNSKLRIGFTVVLADVGHSLTSLESEDFIFCELPFDNMSSLSLVVYLVSSVAYILLIIGTSLLFELVVESVELILAEFHLIVELDVHVLYRGGENTNTISTGE